MNSRLDQYFIDYVLDLKSRSDCRRTQVAAAVVVNDCVVGYGVNGSWECVKKECLRKLAARGEQLENCRGAHAEVRAMESTRYGCIGGTLYCTHHPCLNCARLIIAYGIDYVIYKYHYPGEEKANELLKSQDVTVRCIDESSE